MNKKGKILAIFSIGFLLISAIFAQTMVFTSLIPITNNTSEIEAETTLKTSDVSGSYDWGGADTMDIKAAGINTNTTLNWQGSNPFDFESEMSPGGTSAKTIINKTLEVETVRDQDGNSIEYAKLRNSNLNINATIGNDTNTVAPFYDLIVDTSSYSISAFAEEDPTGFDITDFGLVVDPIVGTGLVSLEYDDVTGLHMNAIDSVLQYIDCLIDLDSTGVIFTENSGSGGAGPFISYYYINSSGLYNNTNMAKLADWALQESFVFAAANNGNLSFYFQNDTLVISREFDGNAYYEMTISKTFLGFSVSFLSFTQHQYSFYWHDDIFTYYYYTGSGVIFFNYYLGIETTGLKYIFSCENWEIEIKFFLSYYIIEWAGISIEIWTYLAQVQWIILFSFKRWTIKIEIWCYNILTNWPFIDYFVWIRFFYLSMSYIYIYFVPTDNLPNLLSISIIEEVYTEDNFDITFEVKDCWGALVDITWLSDITILWDGTDVSSDVVREGTGTYSISLTAELVPPGSPGKWLNISAQYTGYAPGKLGVAIAVDPDAVQKDGDATGLPILTNLIIILTIICALILVCATIIYFFSKFLIKKRKDDRYT